jgi:hypothetical protein
VEVELLQMQVIKVEVELAVIVLLFQEEQL